VSEALHEPVPRVHAERKEAVKNI
jgi:hypothetical protein